MSDNKKELAVFVDGIGRTLVGERVNESKTAIEVKNPAIVHVQPNQQTGQISVQIIPFFFKEFLDPNCDTSTWEFLKSSITLAKGLELDQRLITQYTNMYNVVQAPTAPQLVTPGAPAPDSDTPVIKLFDD